MKEPYVDLLLGISGTLLFGVAVLVTSKMLSPRTRPGPESIMDVVLKTIGWTLIWHAILTLSFSIFIGLPILGIVVLLMIYIRGRKASKHALLSTMGVAAERMMPLVPVIDAFAAEQKGRLAWQARLLASRLRSGWLLPDAMDASGGLVSRQARAVIRTGFESGSLAVALKNAGGDRESQQAVWAHLGGKLVYLTVVLLFVQLLATFMMWKIVPAFEMIFVDFEIALPGLTSFVIEVAHIFVLYGGVLIYPLTPFLWLLVFYALLRYVGLIEFDLPGMTWLARRLHTATILETLAPLARQNRPLVDGVATLSRSYPKKFVRRRLVRVLADLESGVDWCDSMVRRGLMSKADRAVLHAAARVGNLPWAMNEVAQGNRRRMAYKWHVRIQIIFAVIIMAMACGVLIFCVSFFWPLIKLIQDLS